MSISEKKIPLLERIPKKSDPVEKWVEWSLELKKRCERLASDEKKRISQLRKLRKELKIKNKVFAYYKKERDEYENVIDMYESSILGKIFIFFRTHKKNLTNN